MRRGLGILREVVEEWHSPEFVERRLSRLEGIEDLLPRAPEGGATKRDQRGPGGARRAGLQRFTERRERKPLIGLFSEDAESTERPHEPMQGGRVGAGQRRHVDGTPSAVRQMIGETDLRRRMNCRCDPSARAHLNELYMSWNGWGSTLR
jgi:hypothetical protein